MLPTKFESYGTSNKSRELETPAVDVAIGFRLDSSNRCLSPY